MTKATQSRPKVLTQLLQSHKENLDAYNSSETTGASLLEAIDRYKKYERRLRDNLKPNEETLRRFTQNFDVHQTLSQSMSHLKLNSFPHGDLSLSLKRTSAKPKSRQTQSRGNNVLSSSDISSDEEESLGDERLRTKSSQAKQRQLPPVTTTSSTQKQIESISNHTKRMNSSKKQQSSDKASSKNPSRLNKSRYFLYIL